MKKKLIDKGFTLIEIMVALAILGIALTIIMQLFSGGLCLARKSEDYSRAVFYGRQLLEEICLQKEISEREEAGKFEGDYTWKYEIKPYSVLIEKEENGGKGKNFSLKIFNVRVTVFWPSGDKEKSLNFETLKTVVETEES
ncbi:MAG: type II secretion system protein [Deltaproteobacteria bacterium]|nr:type II secretion system protein [Deltaproteobacteria bacterium]